MVSVIPFLQQVLATTEVGMFKENPGALQDLAGLDFTSDPLLLDCLCVFRQLQRLAVKVWSVEELQLEWPFGLKPKQSKH